VWVAWISFVLGIVALAGPLGFLAFLATGIWLLIVTYFMWRHEQKLPEGSLSVSDGAADGLPPSA
jgi:hypothetical protein